jgi:hypothetical protein
MKQETKDLAGYLLASFGVGYLIVACCMPIAYGTFQQCKSTDGLTNLAEIIPVWAWWVTFGFVGFCAGFVNFLKPIWENWSS